MLARAPAGAWLARLGRRRLRLATAILVGVAVAAGCTGGTESGEPQDSGPIGRTVSFAPYVDVTYPDRPVLAEVARVTGQDDFVLSFVLAGPAGCDPTWGGTLPIDDPALLGDVQELRSSGGQVVVASGGAMGPYLENACQSAPDLARAYRSALDAVGSNSLDVDIEGDIPVDLVTEALADVQRERSTAVNLTLQVQDESGLTPLAVDVLQGAADHELDVTVNAMVMNFPPTNGWADSIIAAAGATVDQMRSAWPDLSTEGLHSRLGLTLMIGRNDTGVVTTLDDARTVLEHARTNDVGFLGIWSLARDNGGCPDQQEASSECSGLDQQQYEFTELFSTARTST
jgi:chitinase